MKLLEILDFNPRKTTKDVEDYRGRHLASTDSEIIGSPGSFATALYNPSHKRIATVYKIGTASKLDFSHESGIRPVKSHREDAYLSYLEMIDSLNHINPFFPKVYNLKVFEDPQGHIFYQAEMEKLKDLNDLYRNNKDLSKQLTARYFKEDSQLLYYGISTALSIAVEESRFRNDIIDDDLLDAIHLIEHRVIPLGFHWDMGSRNIMIRLTSVGAQPVLTDPVA